MRASRYALLALATCASLALGLLYVLKPPPTQPNIVLIIGCTLRQDQLTPYGGTPLTTPFLAEKAAQGVVVEDAITAAAWTRMGATAVLTGHHPLSIGMVEPGPGANLRRLPEDARTLAEHLKAAGYTTIGLTGNPNLNTAYGFDRGFDAYRDTEGQWSTGATRTAGTKLVRHLLAMLTELNPAGPIYLQAMLLDSHAPISSTPAQLAPFLAEGAPETLALYRLGTSRFDAAIERLRNGLAEQGIDERNTIFVVVSDHGEGLFTPPSQGRGHGNSLFHGVVGMPWVMWGAGIARGARVTGMASQIDVAPTLAAFANAPGFVSEGQDLSATMARGGSTGQTRAFTDTWFRFSNRAAIYTNQTTCTVDFSALGDEVHEACYDRVRDPGSEHPLPALDAALVTELRAWRKDHQARFDARSEASFATPSEDEAAQLEALGYVEGGDGAPEAPQKRGKKRNKRR